jgi:hypothetical protein
MANTILTVDKITREALRVLHQKSNFVGNIIRDYDDSFAKTGAKIGDTLRVRLPNEYTVRTGAAISTQDTSESSVTLPVQTQKGVDVNFTTAELTMDMDDFSERILDPAMSVLAANIEADALNMVKDVYNLVDSDTAAIDFLDIMNARKVLTDNLAPQDNQRCMLMQTKHTPPLVNELKGLFQDSSAIAQQYKEGMMGKTAGFDFYENTLLNDHTTGTAAKGDTSYDVNGANQTGSSVVVDGGTKTFLKGDVITIAGCTRVHPESKASTGVAQQFVVTADTGASATTISISPSIITSGGRQNVSASPTDNGAITKVGAGASELLTSTMGFHKEAFAFATADLLMPDGVDFASRQVFDGISIRVIRAYDINSDKMPCRIDVLYGYKTVRAQLATRIHADG